MRFRRIALMVMVIAPTVVGPLTEGFAHPIRSFDACAARTRTSETCLRRERYTLNQTVSVRASSHLHTLASL